MTGSDLTYKHQSVTESRLTDATCVSFVTVSYVHLTIMDI
jgi:hypothetical protein